jgi:hypothetical protein
VSATLGIVVETVASHYQLRGVPAAVLDHSDGWARVMILPHKASQGWWSFCLAAGTFTPAVAPVARRSAWDRVVVALLRAARAVTP